MKKWINPKDISKEFLSFLFGLLTTAIGFFLALYFNDRIQNDKELNTFLNIKKSILSEISQNQLAIDSSYFRFIDGVIFNELNTLSGKQQLTNDIFLKYATSELLIVLQDYIRKCELCNKQNTQLKDLRMGNFENKWEYALQTSLEKTLIATQLSMLNLKDQLNQH